MSGLPSLVLSNAEVSVIDQHLKIMLEKIQRLHKATPSCFIYFLAGCLPAEAILHLRQLSLLGMIARLGDKNILFMHAMNVLVCAKKSSRSWFIQIRDICLQYGLPHPVDFLSSPLSKSSHKKLVKSKILNYWENRLRGEASLLPSLNFFNPSFATLSSPHPIWSSAGSSSYEVSKATIQARMLSGRYRTDWFTRHWSAVNKSGDCQLPSCQDDLTPGTLRHLLLECPGTSAARTRVVALWSIYLSDKPDVFKLVNYYSITCANQELFLQFLLDCSSLPLVISAVQKSGVDVINHLFYLTRTWCFSIHKSRMKDLGIWKK